MPRGVASPGIVRTGSPRPASLARMAVQRLLSMIPSADAFRNLGHRGTTNYAYDSDAIVEELNGVGSTLARYTHGLKVDEPPAESRSAITSYYQADGVGSITSLTNSSASIGATYTYDTFGNLSASTGSIMNPFRYTGRESDSDTGLYYHRARYYDRQIGRFNREDPLHLSGNGTNFYPYAKNSPVINSDPFGLKTLCILAGPPGQRALVCWDDGKGNGKGGSAQLIDRPDDPTSPQATITVGIAADYNAFWNCANQIDEECIKDMLPKFPKHNLLTPPAGPTGDMGILPGEGEPLSEPPTAPSATVLSLTNVIA